ncbi:MAG: 50S ribosomal protein L18 [Bacteroidetes bacterium]|nr:50S ribosomal protein L18 [Bacteroidota bacterium]
MSLSKQQRRIRIKYRVRKHVSGSTEEPRLTVFRSNKGIYAQLIDDISETTLVSASSLNKEIAEKKNITKIEQASLVGKLVAEKALEKGITKVVFDRNGYLYHGRIKALAEEARKAGLKI